MKIDGAKLTLNRESVKAMRVNMAVRTGFAYGGCKCSQYATYDGYSVGCPSAACYGVGKWSTRI